MRAPQADDYVVRPTPRGSTVSTSLDRQEPSGFNIKGNDYRLVVAVANVLGAMYIKFVGTHEEYDAINVSTVEPKRGASPNL